MFLQFVSISPSIFKYKENSFISTLIFEPALLARLPWHVELIAVERQIADHHAAAFQPSVGASVTDSGVETKKIIAVEFSIHPCCLGTIVPKYLHDDSHDENHYMIRNTFQKDVYYDLECRIHFTINAQVRTNQHTHLNEYLQQDQSLINRLLPVQFRKAQPPSTSVADSPVLGQIWPFLAKKTNFYGSK